MRDMLKRLAACRRGVTAIEYGLIAALICVVVIGSIGIVGGRTLGMWTNVSIKFPTVQG